MTRPGESRRVRLEDLANAVGLDITADEAYRLLRLGRKHGRPETTSCDPERVPVVAVLARLARLLPELCPPPDEVLLSAARVLHAAAGPADLVGMPRAIVVPVSSNSAARNVPPPAMTSRLNVGGLLAGRAGIVVDLGDILTDWSRHQ